MKCKPGCACARHRNVYDRTHLIRHGRKRYDKGCRCDVCKAAKSEAAARWRTCRRCGNPMPRRPPDLCGICRALG